MPSRDERWWYTDPERPDLAAAIYGRVDTLTGEWGNVYLSIRRYQRSAKTENTRSEAATLPARIILDAAVRYGIDPDESPMAPEGST